MRSEGPGTEGRAIPGARGRPELRSITTEPQQDGHAGMARGILGLVF